MNADMVSGGYAWAYSDATYSGLMASARAGRRGLWADPDPEEPAAYRKRRGIGYQTGGRKAAGQTQTRGQAVPAPQGVQTRTPAGTARKWPIYAMFAAGVCGPFIVVTICKRFCKEKT